MPFIDCSFRSSSLVIHTAAKVIIPQKGDWQNETLQRRWPVLWLLHGLSDDHTSWTRQTSIERYADAHGIAVVMPAVNRSFYADMVSGPAYFTFISEELPALMRAWFPLSAAREDNYVAGLSMGGYGAFKLALNFPERYAAAASLSGALFPLGPRPSALVNRDFEFIFGDVTKQAGTVNDIYHLAQQVAATPGAQPRMYQWCGTEDTLIDANRHFARHAQDVGLAMTVEEGPGDHTWGYWDTGIQRVLEWFDLPPLVTEQTT